MSETNQEKSLMKRVLLITAVLVVGTVGWFVVGDDATNASESGADSGKVLAMVNGEKITEETVKSGLAGRLLALDRQRHEMISGAVDQAVIETLFRQEADKRSITVEALRKLEVDDKAAALAQEEVDAFYEEQKKRSGGRIQPKEQIEPRIREYLALQAFETKLRAAAEIETHVEPFRIDVAATGPAKGPADAPVTIIEFSDFECPYCSRVNPTLTKVREVYGDKVRIVFRQFPLVSIHPNAMRAGRASLCANEQEKFWELHDAMFADQRNLAGDGLHEVAGRVEGLDLEAFKSCVESGKYGDQMQRDIAEGSEAGVSGTPAFFINGRFLNGAVPFEQISVVIDEELEG